MSFWFLKDNIATKTQSLHSSWLGRPRGSVEKPQLCSINHRLEKKGEGDYKQQHPKESRATWQSSLSLVFVTADATC